MSIKQMGIDSKLRILMIIALSGSILQPPFAMAAKDGLLGKTSTGEVGVYLKTGHLVKISGLTDIDLPWDAAAAADGSLTDVTGSIDYCVYTNEKSNNAYTYSMSVSSQNSGEEGVGEFKMKGSIKSNNNLIKYKVFATGTQGVSSNVAANAAHAKWGEGHNPTGTKTLFGGDNKQAMIDCTGPRNARMWVVADRNDVMSAAPDSYADILTLLVSAD
ncbi:hypothetical protein [Endozoicomonas sp. ONNA2]|uniref:hypothetical protein n=1 Tax=Endozoicomonas sp. ONNA2 TaxID=2828741 RepID=UPI00214743A9|nr:hypothetical protein [Endozoicomonas sp. ONNA2]